MPAESMPLLTAELRIVRTSPECLSLRLVANGRTLYTTRSYDFGPAVDEARRRVEAWAQQHHYRIVETEPSRRAS